MIVWEKNSLNDREAIFEFLYEFNPLAAEKADAIIEKKVENLHQQPLMGVEREGIPGRLLIIPEVSMIVSYFIKDEIIHILRVLHQKQKFPVGN
ncbi:type II toxin-antitoxin system RelE/ParE family toxin [Alteromonas stellipolaris]|jgi:toxin ParE1/3/4|uniref:Type II toxin-antitoxin system RelE/ParE family toxin n=1 Tax=Alteromonas stellipolaris TaxID=233316 RepID=A0AAW7YYD1_9ALTE|nr:type II toxin-antitoxin system RelE/ParE family toxin [Alteromonas stellipolaris]MDO6538132.1 type II toxin-antitoxin system RelE/ParE family toxin [Alteromonas stellipolaris]MDO6575760.1 type II toxin-antitoxin system RelE/ParE family toxin [Alteromonas stellipolaris]MDP2596177.1 type II toxin-antitoxin system RelE/ParE family toxin [Alteromonas stellipolaris]|tara:strand:+ start:1164 stop:1445 length:282 start_codon:yes stop_codon:yes gene_type:complete